MSFTVRLVGVFDKARLTNKTRPQVKAAIATDSFIPTHSLLPPHLHLRTSMSKHPHLTFSFLHTSSLLHIPVLGKKLLIMDVWPHEHYCHSYD